MSQIQNRPLCPKPKIAICGHNFKLLTSVQNLKSVICVQNLKSVTNLLHFQPLLMFLVASLLVFFSSKLANWKVWTQLPDFEVWRSKFKHYAMLLGKTLHSFCGTRRLFFDVFSHGGSTATNTTVTLSLA